MFFLIKGTRKKTEKIVSQNSNEKNKKKSTETAVLQKASHSRSITKLDRKTKKKSLKSENLLSNAKHKINGKNRPIQTEENRKIFRSYFKVKPKKKDIFDEYNLSRFNHILNKTNLQDSGYDITLLKSFQKYNPALLESKEYSHVSNKAQKSLKTVDAM